jgi:hypothetical protein
MTKIEHKYKKIGDSYETGYAHIWSITITHNDKTYDIDIENVDYGYRDDCWNGFITEYDEDGDEKLNIAFNSQDVYDSLSCILIGIKEIINGDFSNVDSSDFYHSNINEVVSNKRKILNNISRECLFDKVMDNKRNELRNLSKEELLKFL